MLKIDLKFQVKLTLDLKLITKFRTILLINEEWIIVRYKLQVQEKKTRELIKNQF